MLQTVYKVHHSANSPLGQTDWFDEIKPWFLEYRA